MTWSRGVIFVLSTALVWSLGALYEARSSAPPSGEARAPRDGEDVLRARLAAELLEAQAPLADDQVFVRVAARVRPSVVSILAIGEREASSFEEEVALSETESGDGRAVWQNDGVVAGTGLVLDDQGHILTNLHVIEGGSRTLVQSSAGERFEASLVGRDEMTDLAVLRVRDGVGLYPVSFSADVLPEVGERVLAIGNAYGLGWSVSLGIVSSLHRSGRRQDGGYSDYIQTDAAINPGNSGGPLVDLAGRVVGINCAIVGDSGSSAGIGFALPAADARFVAEELIARGAVRRGYLGVRGRDLDGVGHRRRAELGLPGLRGVLVVRVREEGPAALAGLVRGDVLLEIDGEPIVSFVALRSRIARSAVDSEVTLRVWREGRTFDLVVTLGERPPRRRA